MYKKSTLFTFLLAALFLAPATDLRAQTIDVNAPCLGATFTFALDVDNSPDATGRNVYFYPQSSIEIAFNDQLNRWEIRARGGNFDVYYHNDFASTPNPPDNATSAWEDNAICDGTGAPTVTGNGTQNVLSLDPCANAGGDTDLDGLCDDEDPNPTVADGVLVITPCINDGNPVLLTPVEPGSDGRNRYENSELNLVLAYEILNQGWWELAIVTNGGLNAGIQLSSQFSSYPNPPDASVGGWISFSCSVEPLSISGTGTQNTLGCNLSLGEISTVNGSCNTPASISVAAEGGIGTVSYTLSGDATLTSQDGTFSNLNAGTYTLTVGDAAFPNDACSVSREITLAIAPDEENPTITCPDNISVTADAGQCAAAVTYEPPLGTDNCSDPTTSLIAGAESGTAFAVGETTVTYQVTDGSGNTADCSFTVTVSDMESPTIICPEDISVGTDEGFCDAELTYQVPIGMDNCSDPTTSLIAGAESGTAFAIGETTVSYRVTDGSGNTADCSFTVTVSDAQAPIINCRDSLSLALDTSGMATLTPGELDLGAFDCGEATLSLDREVFSCDDLGEQVVTLTATDEVGLSSNCTVTVRITDDNASCSPNSLRDWLSGPEAVYRLPVFPNPARDRVQIDLSELDLGNQSGELRIFNTLGQVVLRQAFGPGQTGLHTIATDDFAGGTYLVLFRSGTQLLGVSRLLIQR